MLNIFITETLVRDRRHELLDTAARVRLARRLRGQSQRAAPADQRSR
jgi:hypothetical protein